MQAWAGRILELMEEQQRKPAELARACKVKLPSVLQWFGPSGGKPPTRTISGDNLVAAARFLNSTAEWIMTGRGQRELSQATELDLEMLKSAIVSVKESLRALGLELDAFIAAPLIAFAYGERLQYPRQMTKSEYREFDLMIQGKMRRELGYAGAAQEEAASGGQEGAAATEADQAKARAG